MEYHIQPLTEAGAGWLASFWESHWGSTIIVIHGRVYHPQDVAGFYIRQGEQLLGLVTYILEAGECEIVSLDSLREGQGVGSALIAKVIETAMNAHSRRVWLVTTNDNVNALRFYQKRGFSLVRINRNAVDESRKIKPQISEIGMHGIPIRDEIELEIDLSGE
jgi:GNAT superfamily N-acetyltransferase